MNDDNAFNREREDATEDQKGQTHGRVTREAPADPCRGLDPLMSRYMKSDGFKSVQIWDSNAILSPTRCVTLGKVWGLIEPLT